jgi:hypothetical protein
MLAMNRCVEICNTSVAEQIFEGRKTWIFLTIPFFYAIVSLLLFKSVLFNGIHFAWFLNPHVGYLDDTGTIVMPLKIVLK